MERIYMSQIIKIIGFERFRKKIS